MRSQDFSLSTERRGQLAPQRDGKRPSFAAWSGRRPTPACHQQAFWTIASWDLFLIRQMCRSAPKTPPRIHLATLLKFLRSDPAEALGGEKGPTANAGKHRSSIAFPSCSATITNVVCCAPCLAGMRRREVARFFDQGVESCSYDHGMIHVHGTHHARNVCMACAPLLA